MTDSFGAYECLTSDWPVTDGKAFLIALQICAGALDDSLVRDAFMLAAIEAAIPVSSIDTMEQAAAINSHQV